MVLGLLLLALQASPAALPENPTALPELLKRAMQLLQASDRASARRELTEALRLYPASPAVRNFLGVVEAGDGHYGAAERRFQEAVRLTPDYTDAYLNLGRLYQENASHDPKAATKALAAYQAILGYDSAHADARFQCAALLLSMGEFSRSLAELDRLAPDDRDRPAALAVGLAAHAGKGERSEADAAAERLMVRGGFDELDVRPTLGVLVAHGREDLAVRLLEDLRRRGHASSDDLQRLGLLREKAGDYVEARVRLEEAARDRPDSVPLLLDLARVAHKAKDVQGALGYLGHARALEPANARVQFLFGMACVELELGVEAYNSFKEAVRLDPDNAAANYAMGAVCLHRKDPSEAVPYFRKYAELEPNEPRGALALGVAAFQVKDYATARALLAPAAARPETAAAANYYLARMARSETELEEALRFALRSVEANPSYADPWSELGLVYLRLGQPTKAAEALERCLKLDPDHYLGNLHLTMLYSETRDPRESAQRLRFDEIKARRAEEGADFLRPVEVRPY
jgi:tetratricopeptide (TPR) repeat protein